MHLQRETKNVKSHQNFVLGGNKVDKTGIQIVETCHLCISSFDSVPLHSYIRLLFETLGHATYNLICFFSSKKKIHVNHLQHNCY